MTQPTQLHIDNRLSLEVRKTKSGHELRCCNGVVRSLLDDLDHLINILETNFQTQQNMSPLLRFSQIETGPSFHNLFSVHDVVRNHIHKTDLDGSTIYKSKVVHVEVCLQRCMQKQLIDHHTGYSTLLEVDD